MAVAALPAMGRYLLVGLALLGLAACAPVGAGDEGEVSPTPDEQPPEPGYDGSEWTNGATTGGGVVPCTESALCDGRFAGPLGLQHPNVDLLQSKPDGVPLRATGERTAAGGPAYWSWGEHWSSYPLIAAAAEGDQSLVLPAADPTGNLPSFFIRKALELSGDVLSDSQLAEIDSYSTVGKSLLFNPSAEMASYFGNLTVGVHSWKENFPEQSLTALKDNGTIAALEAAYKAGDQSQQFDILSGLLNRDEYGQAANLSSSSSESCETAENTFSSKPSFYCKWVHLGAGQTFRETPLGIPLAGRNLRLRAAFRVFGIQDNVINKYLKDAGLSAHYIHLNLRINLVRKRDQSIDFYHPRKKKMVTKDHDRVVINIPIFEAHDLCTAPQWQSLPFCKREGAHAPSSAFVHPRPDWGTLQFMYKMGRRDQFGADAEKMVKRIANGQWVELDISEFPGFQQHLESSIAACEAKHEGWGMPGAACDVEKTDWRDYSANGMSFGYEVRGVWTAAVALRWLEFSATE